MSYFNVIFSYLIDILTNRLPYFPSNIKMAILVILFCFIGLLELYLFITIRRFRQISSTNQEKIWSERIGNMLANLIVYDESDNPDTIVNHFYAKFKKLPLRKRVVTDILTREIMTYHKNFTGSLKIVLETLYYKLALDKLSIKKIKNNSWEIKIEGIREITEMGVVEGAQYILPYTDDEQALLRMEAQAAYLKLSSSDHFRFLDRAKEKILEWHQLVLFEIITKNKNIAIPSFSNWLRSTNDTVVLFCLKLVEFFMQFDAANELEHLLKHPNPIIVKKTIEVIAKLELSSAEKTLFQIYFEHDEEIKVEILNALGKISSGEYAEFLVSRIYSQEYKIKREAMYAIKKHPNMGLLKLKDIYQHTTLENQVIIKHVMDHRILQE